MNTLTLLTSSLAKRTSARFHVVPPWRNWWSQPVPTKISKIYQTTALQEENDLPTAIFLGIPYPFSGGYHITTIFQGLKWATAIDMEKQWETRTAAEVDPPTTQFYASPTPILRGLETEASTKYWASCGRRRGIQRLTTPFHSLQIDFFLTHSTGGIG